ncbi:MAG: hypothetical protein H7X80_01360, partial [bacterium]|nr:hypothetical protein [Candidatus Kapabacteria bacterium]
MRIVITLLLAFVSLPLVAQHPRMVLIEEGTNASCEPCASQNPTFESFLQRDDVAPYVIPLIYHAFWPGHDTMNVIAPEMHDARVRGYYGMIGMPTTVVNGHYYRSETPGLGASSPADTQAIRSRIDSMRATTSPILITISDSIDGDQLTVATTVSSAQALSHRLRIAIVERHHYYPYPTAGNNGEEHFHWIVRAMLPDTAGRTLSLNAGNSATF